MSSNNKNSNKISDDIKPEERVCFNCKHLLWMVGVGQGVRCSKHLNMGRPELIPSRRHSCEKFEKK